MKQALIMDLHFDDKTVDIENEKDYYNKIKFFKKQFFPTLKEQNIKEFVQFGDFFDKRTKLSTFIQHRIKVDFFDYLEENDIKMTYIIGNHDINRKDTLDMFSLEVFEKAYPNNIEVIKVPTIKGNILYVPWMLEGDEVKVQLILKDNPNIKTVYGHFEMKDFYVSSTYKATHGLDKNFFKGVEVISGHYHSKQQDDNVLYGGIPYQLNYNDFNNDHGFYITDTETPSIKDLEFIENITSPRHLKAILDSESKELTVYGFKEDITQQINSKTDYSMFSNNKIKLYLDKDNAFNKRVSELIIKDCISYKIIIQQNEDESEDENIVKVEFKETDIDTQILSKLDSEYLVSIFNKINLLATQEED